MKSSAIQLKRRTSHERDPGYFVAIPWSVLDCESFRNLSYSARALLLEIARQYNQKNNGQLLASFAYLRKRGWSSADTIHRAKRELLEAGFIFESVKGHRPNKASWFALTFHSLYPNPKFDYGAHENFKRGAYHKNSTLKP